MQMYILINQTIRFIHLITQKSNEFLKYNYSRMRIKNYPLNWNECTIKTDFKDISEILLFKKSNKFGRPIILMVTHYSPLNLCVCVCACVKFLCFVRIHRKTKIHTLTVLYRHIQTAHSPLPFSIKQTFSFSFLSDEILLFVFFFLCLSFT